MPPESGSVRGDAALCKVTESRGFGFRSEGTAGNREPQPRGQHQEDEAPVPLQADEGGPEVVRGALAQADRKALGIRDESLFPSFRNTF